MGALDELKDKDFETVMENLKMGLGEMSKHMGDGGHDNGEADRLMGQLQDLLR